MGKVQAEPNIQPSTVLSWCQSPHTPAGQADLQFDEVRQLRTLRQIPAVPRVPAGRGRGTPPAGAWNLTPREPGHSKEGADGGRDGAGLADSLRTGLPQTHGGGLGRCSAPGSSLCPQKPKLKPGKSLPLGVEELGQLPLAEGPCGRPLRKSFRRGETRCWP